MVVSVAEEKKISVQKTKKLEKDVNECYKTGQMWTDLENTKLKMNALELDKWLNIYASIRKTR